MPAGHRGSGPGPRGRGAGPCPLCGLVLTRGTLKPLRLTPGVQPKGNETPSSYSAGSQRAKARLEAPSVELRLQGKDRALTVARSPGGLGCRPEWPASPPRATRQRPHLLLQCPVMVRYWSLCGQVTLTFW